MRKLFVHVFLLFLLGVGIAAVPGHAFAESDMVQCTENEKRILCNLSMPEFIENIQPLLTNGWENTIQIHISLLRSDGGKVLLESQLEATQRCYLDPFESPCLILWRGASNWLRYRDEAAFLKAFSHFGIQAMTLSELPADNYMIRVTVQVMASAQKRLEAIKSWFKTGSGETDGNSWGTNTLIGSFLSSRAENMRSQAYELTLETAQFFIDLSFDASAGGSPSEGDSSPADEPNDE